MHLLFSTATSTSGPARPTEGCHSLMWRRTVPISWFCFPCFFLSLFALRPSSKNGGDGGGTNLSAACISCQFFDIHRRLCFTPGRENAGKAPSLRTPHLSISACLQRRELGFPEDQKGVRCLNLTNGDIVSASLWPVSVTHPFGLWYIWKTKPVAWVEINF